MVDKKSYLSGSIMSELDSKVIATSDSDIPTLIKFCFKAGGDKRQRNSNIKELAVFIEHFCKSYLSQVIRPLPITVLSRSIHVGPEGRLTQKELLSVTIPDDLQPHQLTDYLMHLECYRFSCNIRTHGNMTLLNTQELAGFSQRIEERQYFDLIAITNIILTDI